MDPEAILATLNPEQREAALAVTGPVVILAGAGTGKTRVISHRVAYAAASSAIDPKLALVVTFTEKAAAEMGHRLRTLGLPQVQASTFHAAARRQLAHFWPEIHGRPLPDVLDSKLRIIGPLARQLPGGYKFTPAKDLADEIEWAKVRRMRPETYEPERDPPVPKDVFTRFWRSYELGKARADRIDFEDMLTLAVELYEGDDDAIGLVRRRYSWFSVDEYQDTNRLQEDLLRLWLGDRRDLCVVGDPDQTIYSFTGASSDYLTTFADRYADAHVVRLSQNYRSTPQVLELANRLIPGRELHSSETDGPKPELVPHPDGDRELVAVVGGIRALLADGVAATDIAVLVRTNAQLVAFEAALSGAGIPFSVRGTRFFARPDVRVARAALTRTDTTGRLSRIVVNRWRTELGFDEASPAGPGAETRDRHAALSTLLAIARRLEVEQPDATVADFLAELARRDAAEADAGGEGVTLSTLHRAKGLEWDAVFLPQLEEGTLPIRQAASDFAALAEERRLLYVGITRTRRHLVLSWAHNRVGVTGTSARARPSRFIAELRPGAVARPRAAIAVGAGGVQPTFEVGQRVHHARRGPGVVGGPSGDSVRVDFDDGAIGVVSARDLRTSLDSVADEALLERLTAWRRERARADGVPAYVVADNKTLAAIAATRPSDSVELLGVPGIGQQKVATYGEEILELIAER
jgi:DNA helicase-2/ATP-dependent DNA helicase PcrA